METLCTIIVSARLTDPRVFTCQPLKDALKCADGLHATGQFGTVRVYAETNNGATLTLIYQPTEASR